MDPLILRAIERILGVLIGGLAIYLGYQLFMHLPTQMNSEGKIVLPGNISVYLSRVGPGAFFALFGTIVVAASFYFQLKVAGPAQDGATPARDAASGGVAIQYLAATEGVGDKQALASARSRMLSDIRVLNKLQARLGGQLHGDAVRIAEDERTDIIVALPRFKLAMLFTVWDKDWGDYASFAKWAKTGGEGPPPRGTEKAAALIQGK